MKLAAIDIGSNSVHMVVARIDGEGSFEIVARHKEMVRLGAGTLTTGYLDEDAQRRGVEALASFKRIADGYGADDIIACATSATREARNGQEFIERVREEAGVAARIIEGTEEGRLIYLGVREIYDFGSRRVLIVDIGGGSVEFVLADRRREYLVHSLKLGVRRLADQFLPGDPPSRAERNALEEHIERALSGVGADVARRGFDAVVATSGTARALARITAARTGGNEQYVAAADLEATVKQLARTKAADRTEVPGLDDKRRDAILEGGILMHTILRCFGARGYEYVDAALREGMIIDYLERNRPGLRMMEHVPDPRRRSVLQFARRMHSSTAHVEQVSRIAVRLFDDLRPVHGLDDSFREVLEYAALLHDVGRSVSQSSHHKHTLYIVRHADLAGFSDTEKLLLANIGRYHRRSIPKARHPEWSALPEDLRAVVVTLSTLLRLANALDQGHQGNVKGLRADDTGEAVRVALATWVPPEVELRAAEGKAHHVERVFGRRLELVEVADAPALWEAA